MGIARRAEMGVHRDEAIGIFVHVQHRHRHRPGIGQTPEQHRILMRGIGIHAHRRPRRGGQARHIEQSFHPDRHAGQGPRILPARNGGIHGIGGGQGPLSQHGVHGKDDSVALRDQVQGFLHHAARADLPLRTDCAMAAAFTVRSPARRR
jgi:hypothetical protein